MVQRRFKTNAYVTDPLWVRFLQGAFGLIVILDIAILLLLWNRKLNLTSDPGSLGALLAAVTPSKPLLADFQGSEFMKFEDIAKTLKSYNNHYTLEAVPGGGHRIDKVIDINPDTKPLPQVPICNEDLPKIGKRQSLPWELSYWTGSSFVTAVFALMVLFLALYISGTKYDGKQGLPVGVAFTDRIGLPQLSNTAFVRNLAFSYAPTIAAMFIEQYLSAMARFVCLVMPLHEMYSAPAPSDKSLTIHYEHRPPHFLLLKSIGKQHYLLAGLISSILLANILAVSLGGLFLPSQTTASRDVFFLPMYDSVLQANRIYTYTRSPSLNLNATAYLKPDPGIFYTAIANKSGGITFPPWTTEDYYFQPMLLTDNSTEYISRHVETWGIGTRVSCATVEDSHKQLRDISAITKNSDYYELFTKKFMKLSTDIKNCQSLDPENGAIDLSHEMGFMERTNVENSTKKVMLESGAYLDSYFPLGGCTGTFFASWEHYSGKINKNSTSSLAVGLTPESDSFYMVCKATNHASRFSVKVDPAGYVLQHKLVEDARLSPTPFLVNPADSIGGDPRPISEPGTNGLSSPGDALSYAFQQFVMSQTWGININGLPRTDPRPLDWLTFLIEQSSPEMALGTRHNATATAEALQKVYTYLFPIFMSTYSTLLFPAHPDSASAQVLGSYEMVQDRMRVSRAMMVLSVAILGVFAIVVTWTYVLRPGVFLKHVPTTMAASLPSIYASKIGDDLVHVQTLGKGEMEKFLKRGYRTYGYGWFRGRDGVMHWGVDREPVNRAEKKPWV